MMVSWRDSLALAVPMVFAVLSTASAQLPGCLGEFQLCPNTGECTLFDCKSSGITHCKPPQNYRCPISNHCVMLTEYSSCPGLKGTHFDTTLSTERRVDKLVGATNLTEQIMQLQNAAPAIERIGLPAYQWLNDDEHGAMSTGTTTFFGDGPSLGATFDKDLLLAVGTVVGREARAQHNTQVGSNRPTSINGMGITLYGPNMNLVRDPRWGRNQEVYSEDPCLTSALTHGYVAGIQNAGSWEPRPGAVLQAGACCKHLAVYDVEGCSEGPVCNGQNRMTNDANVTTRSMWEHYLPAFHSCTVEAKAVHAMCSYNSINGVPTCADPNLMNNILRKQWGWPGFVVSDYDAFAQVYTDHKYTKDMMHAAAKGLNAGLDQEGGGNSAIMTLPAAVSANLTTSHTVEMAFRRLMRARLILGMFDPPDSSPYNKIGATSLKTLEATALNRRAAREGVVMLLNKKGADGRPLLPLTLGKFKGKKGSIVVGGPQADNAPNTLGNYDCGYNAEIWHNPGYEGCTNNHTSVVGGLRNGGTGLTGGEVVYEPGCISSDCTESDFGKLVSVAKQAELVIAVLGTQTYCNHTPPHETHCRGYMKNGSSFETEGHDRDSIRLAGHQLAIASALVSAGPKASLLCILIHGGSLALSTLTRDCTAIITAWFPGQQGGAAIADIIFGKVSPAGRSPVTWYSSDAELPPTISEYDLYSGKGLTYRYYRGKPTVPFGAGLSYTTFQYSNFKLNASSIGPCDTVSATVDVQNIGKVLSDEVVQLYLQTPAASVPSPQVRLADFHRVRELSPGSTVTVNLLITPQYLSVIKNEAKDNFWDPTIAVEAGEMTAFVGGGQPMFTTGVLNTSLTVARSGALTTHFKCA